MPLPWSITRQTKRALICNVTLAQYGSSQLASITFIQGTLLNTTLFDVRSGVLFYGKRDSVAWPNIAHHEKRNTWPQVTFHYTRLSLLKAVESQVTPQASTVRLQFQCSSISTTYRKEKNTTFMIRWKIIIKTVKTSRERVQIRQKLYVRIEFGQKIIVYNLLVRVNNDTTAWKRVI